MQFQLEDDDISRIADAVAAKLSKTSKPEKASDENLWDVPDIMEYLQVSERFIRQEVAAFRLPHFKIGRNVKFKRSEIDEHLRRCAVAPLRIPGRG